MSEKRNNPEDNEVAHGKFIPAPGLGKIGRCRAVFSGNGAETIDTRMLEENSMDLCCMGNQKPLLPTLSNMGLAPGLCWEQHMTAEEQEQQRDRLREEMHDNNVCYWHHG
jgi:hypothetical protein